MALLSSADEQRVWRGLMRYCSAKRIPMPFSKSQLLAGVQSLNVYLDGAATARPATSVNAAFPQPGLRDSADAAMKGLIVAVVALAQTGNIDLLRAILGEVD